MARASIDELDVKGKRVLLRVDFNVPLDANRQITNDARIQAALPTIRTLLKRGGRVITMSHLGRPKGKTVPEMSLSPAAVRLGELLEQDVSMAPDCIGPAVETIVNNLQDGQCCMLENLRFHAEEEGNDAEFCKALAALGDVYVNDAFGTAHRAHASTAGVASLMKEKAAGYLMEKELQYLSGVLQNPEKPFTAILGGAKISGKIDVISNLLNIVDVLIIGGGMANTFLKAKGVEVGTSLVEDDKVELAAEILEETNKERGKLLLPIDVMVANEFSNDAEKKEVIFDEIPGDWQALDIGQETIGYFSAVIQKAKTILWNGPMGVFEMPNFARGTMAIAEVVAEATKKGAVSVVGGGDSVAALKVAGVTDDITHVSTGGGASLEFLEGRDLPGVVALES